MLVIRCILSWRNGRNGLIKIINVIKEGKLLCALTIGQESGFDG